MTSGEIMANENMARDFFFPTKCLLLGSFIESQFKDWLTYPLKKIKYFKYREQHNTPPHSVFQNLFQLHKITAGNKQIYFFCS